MIRPYLLIAPILQSHSNSALSDELLKPTCLWCLLCQPSSSDLPHISSTASLPPPPPPPPPPPETLMPVHLLLLVSVGEYRLDGSVGRIIVLCYLGICVACLSVFCGVVLLTSIHPSPTNIHVLSILTILQRNQANLDLLY